MSWENYTYKESTHVERKPGTYRCMILNAEQTVSKSSGTRMIALSLRPSGTASTVKGYILDNDHFDENYSEFLDAFPAIKENPDINACYTWRGAVGTVKLIIDESGYFKTAKFPWVSARKADALPPFEWKARSDEPPECPEYQGFTELGNTDDLPFEV